METNQGLFLLHLLRFPGRYQSQMMRRLRARGYADLRLSYSPVMTELARESQRLTDLAARMAMQKQNCAQLVRRIEAAGYIERLADPADGRSRLLALNTRGRALVRDGVSVIGELDAQLSAAIGPEAFAALERAVLGLHRAISVHRAAVEPEHATGRALVPGALINALIQIAGHAGSELNALVRARGYTEIRPAHEQVLLHLGEGRVRIQDIARENDVSRQAIGAVVNELQDLGYIRLDVDPGDARGRLIRLTSEGNTLVEHSAEVAQDFLQQYIDVLGQQGFTVLTHSLADVYGHLGTGIDDNDATLSPVPARALGAVRFILARLGIESEEAAALASSSPRDEAKLRARLAQELGEQDVAGLERVLARLG